MAKPPEATPHSDIDGVHQEEVENVKVASELGQSGGALEQAKEESIGRPEYQDDVEDREDRTD